MKYNSVLNHNIECEKNGTDYVCPLIDRKLLNELFARINQECGTNIHYLAEIDAFNICGCGNIIAKYINRFSSQSVIGFLIPQMVADKIKDCDKLILRLYWDFRSSDEYIEKPEQLSSAHIYVRYDNAFKKLKPKRLADNLMEIVRNPRDAYYLPFTVRMLASWKIPQMRDLLISYLTNNLSLSDVGICGDSDAQFYPSLESIKRELKFTAINGLRYFPSLETKALIESFASSRDKDIQAAAKRVLKVMAT